MSTDRYGLRQRWLYITEKEEREWREGQQKSEEILQEAWCEYGAGGDLMTFLQSDKQSLNQKECKNVDNTQ